MFSKNGPRRISCITKALSCFPLSKARPLSDKELEVAIENPPARLVGSNLQDDPEAVREAKTALNRVDKHPTLEEYMKDVERQRKERITRSQRGGVIIFGRRGGIDRSKLTLMSPDKNVLASFLKHLGIKVYRTRWGSTVLDINGELRKFPTEYEAFQFAHSKVTLSRMAAEQEQLMELGETVVPRVVIQNAITDEAEQPAQPSEAAAKAAAEKGGAGGAQKKEREQEQVLNEENVAISPLYSAASAAGAKSRMEKRKLIKRLVLWWVVCVVVTAAWFSWAGGPHGPREREYLWGDVFRYSLLMWFGSSLIYALLTIGDRNGQSQPTSGEKQ